jgi:hypothetical protein
MLGKTTEDIFRISCGGSHGGSVLDHLIVMLLDEFPVDRPWRERLLQQWIERPIFSIDGKQFLHAYILQARH